MHIDLSPLIPVVNGLIVTIASILTASTPVIAFYIVKFFRNHGIMLAEGAQKIISDRIGATIQNGLKFATSGADAGINKLNITVENPTVAAAANYAILQSPDLLKKAGIDVTTTQGQAALVRRVTAESMPTPAALAPTKNLNINEDQKQVGEVKA